MTYEEQNHEKESMSYEEKNITVSLVSHLLIAGYYAVNWFQMVQAGELVANRLYGLWAIVIVDAAPAPPRCARRVRRRW